MASKTSTAKKQQKVQLINEVVEAPRGEVNRPKIPNKGRIGRSSIWDAATARQYDGEVTDLADYVGVECYTRWGSALSDEIARKLQGEEKFVAEAEKIAETVAEAEVGRIRDALIVRLGWAMLAHLTKSVLALLHFGTHGLQIGLFRRQEPGVKGFTVELPVGTLQNWEWVTLSSAVPDGNDIIAKLRPFADAAHAKLRQEEERVAAARLETLKGNTKNFNSVMKGGNGRTVCYVPSLRSAPECWLDLGLKSNQIRVLYVGAGNDFQQSLVGVVIPWGAVEAGRFSFNTRRTLDQVGRLRRAEYLLASLLDAVRALRSKLGASAPAKPIEAPVATPSVPESE